MNDRDKATVRMWFDEWDKGRTALDPSPYSSGPLYGEMNKLWTDVHSVSARIDEVERSLMPGAMRAGDV